MDKTIKFLEALYRNTEGYAEMRLIHKSGDWQQARKIYRTSTTIHTCNMDYLTEMNSDYHIYHRVNVSATQASKKTDITQVTALWLDVDGIDDNYYQRLEEFKMPPNVVINSGGGYHAYWLLREPVTIDSEDKRFEVERIMQGMILAYGDGADDATKDITRILRTPNFYNIKDKYPEHPLCHIIYHDDNDNERISYDIMKRAFHHLGAPKVLKPRRHVPSNAYSDDLPLRVQNFIKNGTCQDGRNQELFYCARAYNDAGKPIGEAERDLIPVVIRISGKEPFTENEALRTIRSAYARSSSPRLNNNMSARYSLGDVE